MKLNVFSIDIENWYLLFNNISISYLAALIFFVLQVYIPQINGEQLAYDAIKLDIRDIEKLLSITQECLKYYVRYKVGNCETR